jgi:uncharacterized protein (TIGR04255 family)
MPHYARPPITEAVLAVSYVTQLRQDVIEKAAGRLKKAYQSAEPETMTRFTVNTKTRESETTQSWSGVKLTSADQTDVLLCRSAEFVCSRLAPYPGWEQFRKRAERDWQIWRETVGSVQIRRIGLRYINRIDIPATETGLKIEDYLKIAVALPEGPNTPISGYALQVSRPLESDKLKLTVNSATVPSPLIGHASLILDIDVFRDDDVPRRNDEMWMLIEKMRAQKNVMFENCITDRARSLFS